MKYLISYILFLILSLQMFAQEDIEVKYLSINSREYDEFAPSVYDNSLIFCSNRRTTVGSSITTDNNNSLLTKLFSATIKNDGKLGNVNLFAPELAGISNLGPVSFNKSNNIYFTKNSKDAIIKSFGQVSEAGKLGIFRATKNGDKWEEIKAFEHNDASKTLTHPSVNSKGDMLFFASNIGGFGGSDIYFCQYKDGRWSVPTNLGEKINTDKNELFPYYHPSGRLYFASQGHNSMGGLDLFYTEFINNQWTDPVQLDKPINSEFDDFGIVMDSTLLNGYFSSNRKGSDDIYSIKSNLPEFCTCDTLKETDKCFSFFEETATESDNKSLIYEWNFGDGFKKRGIEVNHCFEKTGTYTIKLNVIDPIVNTELRNVSTYELEIKDIIQPYISLPYNLNSNKAIKLDASKSNLTYNDPVEYYWDLGDGYKSKGKELSHSFSKPGNYTVKLMAQTNPKIKKDIKKTCVLKTIQVN